MLRQETAWGFSDQESQLTIQLFTKRIRFMKNCAIILLILSLVASFFHAKTFVEAKSTHKSDATAASIETPSTTKVSGVQAKIPTKFYALHLGPSKTGTTAIQEDLTLNPFGPNTIGEDKDNVIYLGKRVVKMRPDPNQNKAIRTDNGTLITPKMEKTVYKKAIHCMIEILDEYIDNNTSSFTNKTTFEQGLDTDKNMRASLRQSFLDKCWIFGGKSYHYMLNSSIIESDEGYSYSIHGKIDNIGKRLQVIDILGYERVIVVGAYRRYAEWIVSAYTESLKKTSCLGLNLRGSEKAIPCKQLETYLRTYIRTNGKLKYSTGMYSNVDITLQRITEVGPSKVEVKLLNFFQEHKISKEADAESGDSGNRYKSIATELYCDALGIDMMPHTCSYKRATECKISVASTNTTSSRVVNKGSLDDSVYQQIVAAGYRLGYLIPPDEELQHDEVLKNKCKNVWCLGRCLTPTERKDTNSLQMNCEKKKIPLRRERDEVTINDQISIMGTNSSSISTWRNLSHHHKIVLNSTWTESLPIKCLPEEILKDLLKKSLKLEQLMAPDFYATPLGKKEHERLFWDDWLGGKKLFCWIDIVKLFQNATSWDEVIWRRMANWSSIDGSGVKLPISARMFF